MEVSGQMHTLTALVIGKQISLLTESRSWVGQRNLKKKKTFRTCQESKEDFPDVQPAA